MAATVRNPTIVGALACQKNSFLKKDFRTTVVQCEPTKKKSVYELILQDTILFPEGGGQPSDSGLIRSAGSKDEIVVSQVVRKGLNAVHLINEHVEPGTEVCLEINWQKRMDFMQQHTGQHLVSAILDDKWKLDTLSWSMGGVPTDKKPIVEPYELFNYIEIGRKLSEEELLKLSDACNDYITVQDQPITVTEHGSEAIDAEKGAMRTICIGKLDANPCCGTHLQNTSQIGSILFSPFQTSARGTNSRVYFMCGSRVLKYAKFAHTMTSRSKTLLSCSEAEIPQKIELQRAMTQKVSKREQYWMKEVANSKAASLFDAVVEKRKAWLALDEFGTLDMLSLVQKTLTSKIEEQKIEGYKFVICGREKATNSGVVMIVSDSADEIANVASSLGQLVEKLKGGGGKKGGKWQGKVAEYGKPEWDSLVQFLGDNF
ncbi:LADA_0H13960g1_1 [Lachancea dasiensis]|uniref:LADA_0H13960g1_1 n=1 Tax=Lachancea dasiensis TaxID=1072105 RepID=A0A1G4K4B0_9SACH|nr:LADA_0H13960g1_1 [Lachancea dasiensis]